jgi:hypothetical protein
VQEFLPPEILAAIASQYRRAGTAAVRNYETQKADEDSLTGALGASLAMVEGEAAAHGVRYTWRTLSWKVRGRGPGAPESINGADAFLTFDGRLRLRDTVVGEYRKFATSFTTIHAEDIRKQVEAIYAEGRFWPEPLIQINPSYKRGPEP